MAWTDEKRALVISEYSDTMANEYDRSLKNLQKLTKKL